MSLMRRSRIKASASHLASLAGKRRVGGSNAPNNEADVTASPNSSETVSTEKENAQEVVCEDSRKAVEAAARSPSPVKKEPTRPLLKSRFRPNLSEADQQRGRLRRISGCESVGSPATPGRVRNISGGSFDSTDVLSPVPPSSPVCQPSPQQQPPQQLRRPPPVVHRAAASEPAQSEDLQAVIAPLRTRKPSENNSNHYEVFSPPACPPSSRTRKLTETDANSYKATVFDQRKADHKKKFGEGIPERTKITMFDLIYYNPSDGNKMSNSSSLRSSRAPSVDGRGSEPGSFRRASEDAVVPNRLNAVAERLREEAVDEEGLEEEEEEDALPVPQVKVGPDGSIVIDEASTLIETTAAKKAKEDLLKSPLVFESANQPTNYGSWGKKKKNADWSDKDTIKFYKALSVFGTDFSLMEGVFKKRGRHELKMKFKKEERLNRALVDKCLSQGQTFDPSIFDSDQDSDDENVEKGKKKPSASAKKRKKKAVSTESNEDPAKPAKRRKHRIKGRRYFEDDSDDADESELASESEVANIDKMLESIEQEAPAKKAKKPDSLLKTILSQGKQPAFPPALLAANPGLANASPGSLVVVASPAPSPQISSPNAQLLQVFMVGEESQDEEPEDAAAKADTNQPQQQQQQQQQQRTRTISESHLDTTSIGRVRTHSGTFQ